MGARPPAALRRTWQRRCKRRRQPEHGYMPPRPHAWRAAATRNHNRGTWRTAREKCRGSGGLTSSSPACPIFCPSSIRRRKRPRLHTCTRNRVRAGQHGGNHGISRHPVHQDFSPRTSAIMICWRAFAHDTQGRTAVNPAAESTKHAPFPLKKIIFFYLVSTGIILHDKLLDLLSIVQTSYVGLQNFINGYRNRSNATE